MRIARKQAVPDRGGASMVARIVRAADGAQRPLRYDRGTATELVTREIGAEALDLHVNRLRPGTPAGPYHFHTNSENFYYVLAGRLAVRLSGEDHLLGPGDVAFIPPGVPHSATNAGDDEAVVIEIYAPPEADFVEVTEGNTEKGDR